MKVEPLERFDTKDEIRIVLNWKGIGDVIVAAYSVAGIRKQYPSEKIVFDVTDCKALWATIFTDAEPQWHVRPKPCEMQPIEKLMRGPMRYHLNGEFTRHHQYAKRLRTKPAQPSFATPLPFDWGKVGLNRPPVLIAPQSTQDARMWQPMPASPDTNWARLAEMLEAEGIPVLALSSVPFGRSYKAESPTEMLSIIASAPLLIGNDSGPAHMAGLLGKYCLALTGIDNGAGVFGYYPKVRAIQGKLKCSPCLRVKDYGFGTWCNGWCEALAKITPEEVFGEAISILSCLPMEELCQ